MPLSPDVTILDIADDLLGPEAYVRGVLANMVDFRKEHGDVVVRLGVTGQGRAPNYRLQVKLGHLDEFLAHGEPNEAQYYSAFRGSSHKQIEWGARELRGEHWSNGAMTFVEVQSLLGRLRGFRAPSSGASSHK